MSVGAERAALAATEWLVDQAAPEAAIAAHEQGVADSDTDAERWVRFILDEERDGAWDGDLLATARALLVLHELKRAASLKKQDPAIGRALDWVHDRQSRPGAWTDGCTAERHRLGLCHHFMGGFLSPGPPGRPLMDVDLPSGVRTSGDPEARFAISAVALRSLMLWRGVGTDAQLHLEGLRRIVDGWSELPLVGLTTTALLAAVHALVTSPRTEHLEAAGRALRMVAGKQRADGSWMDADPFHAMVVFGDAADVGVEDERTSRALDYGARLLIAAQRDDGSWGGEHGPRRALIGLRTLRRAAP